MFYLLFIAHPKIKAFLTHGGMGSITEGVHFSVPLICIPVLAEQDFNSLAITEKGAAVMLEIVDLTQEQVEHAISEILNNPKYAPHNFYATSCCEIEKNVIYIFASSFN